MSKWKHGLRLMTCESCINESRIPYNCHYCNDFGEYWVLTTGKRIMVGDLLPKLAQLSELQGDLTVPA